MSPLPAGPQVGVLVALWRLVRLVSHLVAGVWTMHRTFLKLSAAQKEERIQAWALDFIGCIAIDLVVKGVPAPKGPLLIASNHISWLDIVVLHAARYCRFVSKSELSRWPLVGTLATGAGTLYIERESRRDAMRVVHQMAQGLRDGDVLAVFPEGTTSDGVDLLPFHANLLQAAISAEAPVQPLALSFQTASDGAISFAPSFVGDDTLVASIWRTLRAKDVVAVLHFGEPQTANGRDRRTWAADLRNDIRQLKGAVKLPG